MGAKIGGVQIGDAEKFMGKFDCHVMMAILGDVIGDFAQAAIIHKISKDGPIGVSEISPYDLNRLQEMGFVVVSQNQIYLSGLILGIVTDRMWRYVA